MKIPSLILLTWFVFVLQSCDRRLPSARNSEVEFEDLPVAVVQFFERNARDYSIDKKVEEGQAVFSITGIKGKDFSILEYSDLLTTLETNGEFEISHPFVTFDDPRRFFYVLRKLK